MCVLYRTAFRCVRFLGAEFVCAVYRSALSTNGFYHFVKPFLTILWLRRALFCMYEYVRKSVYLLLWCIAGNSISREMCRKQPQYIYIHTIRDTIIYDIEHLMGRAIFDIKVYIFKGKHFSKGCETIPHSTVYTTSYIKSHRDDDDANTASSANRRQQFLNRLLCGRGLFFIQHSYHWGRVLNMFMYMVRYGPLRQSTFHPKPEGWLLISRQPQ